MKKLLLLSLIAGVLISTNSNAQGSGPAPSKPQVTPQTQQQQPQFTPEQIAAMVKEAKAKQSPMLVEKAGKNMRHTRRIDSV